MADSAHADGRIRARIVLPHAHLRVELQQDGPGYLIAQSQIDPAQSYLLSLTGTRICGLTQYTALGRIHALYWAMAYGVGPIPAASVIRFDSGTSRYRSTVEVTPMLLAADYWVADAEGIFATAALIHAGEEIARTELAARR